jgi:hypothetical protein
VICASFAYAGGKVDLTGAVGRTGETIGFAEDLNGFQGLAETMKIVIRIEYTWRIIFISLYGETQYKNRMNARA